MNKSRSGFTIVELLIVIVVIAILAAISIVAYNGIQTRARDTDRSSDINALQKSLELFNADKGYYPAVQDVTNATFRANNLNIPESLVKPPGSSSPIAYCWSNNPGQYCYVGRAAPGGSFDCTAAGEQCIGYNISYRLEKNPSTMVTITK